MQQILISSVKNIKYLGLKIIKAIIKEHIHPHKSYYLGAWLLQVEHSLAKEKEAKAKLEKEKRKVEGDLKDTKDQLMESQNEVAATKELVSKYALL